jgi:hypothetical protein
MDATNVVAVAPEGALSFGRGVLDHLGIAVEQTEAIIRSIESNDYAALRGMGSIEE